jgi:hypothetical protein
VAARREQYSNGSLNINNTSFSGTTDGINLSNSATGANSNINLNFVDYQNSPYAQLQGVYSGSAKTGSLAFLIGNGSAPIEVARITNAGNVGIGTTSPAQLLSVQGNALLSGNLVAANITATGTLSVLGLADYASTTIGNGTQAGGLTISGGATTTGNAYFAGSVGIGTTNPASQLMGKGLFRSGRIYSPFLGRGLS